MKRKLFKRALSLGLGLSMLFSASAFAGSTPISGGEKEIIGGVISPIIDLAVPESKDITVAINPFMYKDDSQITSPDLIFFNKSQLPVNFMVDMKIVDVKSGVKYTDNKAQVNDHDDSGDDTITEKQIYIEAVPADGNKAGTTDPVVIAAADEKKLSFETGTEFGYYDSDATKKAILGVAPKFKTSSLQFYLNKADYKTISEDKIEFEKTAGLKSAAVFRFMGFVNPYAKYEAGDVTVSLVYEAKGIEQDAYDGATTNGMNLKDVVTTEELTSYGPSARYISGATNQNVLMSYDLGDGAAAGTGAPKVTASLSGQAVQDLTTYVTIDTDAQTITIKPTYTKYCTKGKSLAVTLTFENDAVAKVTIPF